MSTLEIKSNIANNEEKLAVECGYSSVLRFAIETSTGCFFTPAVAAEDPLAALGHKGGK